MIGINLDESRENLLSQIRNLERFCTEVLAIKLFWTPDILNFFEIPKDILGKFEIERGKYEQRCFVKIEGINRKDDERRQSYSDLRSYLLAEEDLNETGDSGSAD